MRGRPPKPTRLKVLTGNPGKRPLNYNEPRPEPMVPDCPPELSPAGQGEWHRLVSEMGSLNLLTSLDRAALAAYCGAYALWAEATEAIQKCADVDGNSEGERPADARQASAPGAAEAGGALGPISCGPPRCVARCRVVGRLAPSPSPWLPQERGPVQGRHSSTAGRSRTPRVMCLVGAEGCTADTEADGDPAAQQD